MTQATPPGWYPDGQGATRYWDGTHWAADAGAPIEPPPVYAPPPQSYSAPVAATHHASTSSRRRMPWWQPVGLGVLILIGGVGIGAAAGNKTAKAAPAVTVTATATVDATITATPTVIKTIGTRTLTATVTYTPPPPTQFGEGTYVVGTDIQPGTYKTTGGDPCYWARLSSLNTQDIIDNSNSTGLQTVQILASDKAFEVTGSCTFGRAG